MELRIKLLYNFCRFFKCLWECGPPNTLEATEFLITWSICKSQYRSMTCRALYGGHISEDCTTRPKSAMCKRHRVYPTVPRDAFHRQFKLKNKAKRTKKEAKNISFTPTTGKPRWLKSGQMWISYRSFAYLARHGGERLHNFPGYVSAFCMTFLAAMVCSVIFWHQRLIPE